MKGCVGDFLLWRRAILYAFLTTSKKSYKTSHFFFFRVVDNDEDAEWQIHFVNGAGLLGRESHLRCGHIFYLVRYFYFTCVKRVRKKKKAATKLTFSLKFYQHHPFIRDIYPTVLMWEEWSGGVTFCGKRMRKSSFFQGCQKDSCKLSGGFCPQSWTFKEVRFPK